MAWRDLFKRRGDGGPALAMAVCIAGVLLLAGSREPPWGDARIMYEVGEAMATRGEIDVRLEWPPQSHRGPDGKIYSQYALGPSLVHVPTVWMRQGITSALPSSVPLARVVTSHLSSALAAVVVALFFFSLARRLGTTSRVASLGTAALLFTTMIFVYARSPYSEIWQAATMLGFFSALLAAAREPGPGKAVAVGAWAGALVLTKAVLALSAVGGALFLLIVFRRDGRRLGQLALWGSIGAAPLVGAVLLYNHLRWGNPLDTGYGETLGLMKESVVTGLWGLFLSPGKSLFLFSPPLIAGVLALPRFARAHRLAALAMALLALPPIFFYARFLSWSGDYCWGPRYLTFVVPLLWLPAVVSLWPTAGRLARVAVALLVALGLCVQLLGASLYWDHWIRIAMQVRTTWLGTPNRHGAALPTNKLGLCDSCFEDMHGHQWLPPLSPVWGHYFLFRHRGEPWAQAEKDAPWRRYTNLPTPTADTFFRQVRLDWWGLVWLDDAPTSRSLGIPLLCLFIAMAVGGGIQWWRRVRGAASTTDPPSQGPSPESGSGR